ncbi:hypothetical protein [Zunongwangia sp. HGR-M22]|uniref:hypothetical protein n=1 Tax=Zunongwangia sp. HGR-M22 TaxID=3015168 RepID=UPI0022DDE19A|nr:hypothetical protein [Zunongwangia sp. HGR-M22]WBL25119.1 hypothetical protein PBT91_14595 [Zunongwangia sp. HGR-M22]
MIVRSKKPLIIDSRSGTKSVIALQITGWTKECKNNRYKAEVSDCTVSNIERPMAGDPLKSYKQFNSKTVYYSNDEIDALFSQIGESITPEMSYSEKQSEIIAKALLSITQKTPIYGSSSEDWELVDETSEIQLSET